MAPGDSYEYAGERVVVGVSKDPSCKDAIKWAIANKLRSPDDILILLHVVTKIPSPNATEMFQSEVNNTMFVHYVRTVVQPMMLSLKKLVDSRVKLELKVGRNNSREKGIVEESKKLKASTLVLGTNARGMFSMRGKSSSTGAYCVRYKPPGVSVYVIQKDKVVLFKEAEGSPHSSFSGSPSGSGHLSSQGPSGPLEPTYSGAFHDSVHDYHDERYQDQGGYGQPYGQQQYPYGGGAPPYGAPRGPRGVDSPSDTSPYGSGPMQPSYTSGGGSGSMQPSYYSEDAGGMPPSGRGSGSGQMNSRGGPGSGQMQPQQWSGGNNSPGVPGGGDIQHAAALSAMAWGGGGGGGDPSQSEYLAEFEAWKKANAAATYQQQQDYMSDLQGRMAKARMALAGMQLGDNAGDSGDYGPDLRKELELMRRKAAEAEKARMEAELRAQRAMSEADRSLKEAEAQKKQRELETAVKAEMAAQEAAKGAQAKAVEAKKKGEGGSKGGDGAVATGGAVPWRQSFASYREYSYEDVRHATDDFKPNRKLGEGGFGTVFSGTLHHTPVAIKVLKNTDGIQAASEFQKEVEVLSQIQHPHVVMLLGCCYERHCLVYEFMANGSLEDRLQCANGSPPLPWYIRLRVAAEIASALLILHTRPVPIVHRDLKPGNILLDKNFVAKLGDVGLAKLMPGLSMDQTYMRESVPVGTFAYVDPEFQRTGEFGPKSDVYALGIVLLDLLTGRKPNVYEGLEEAVDDGEEDKLAQFLDEKAGKWPLDLAMEIAQIAVKCSEMRRKKRPELENEVMPVLERARARAAEAEEEARNAPTQRSSDDDKQFTSFLYCPITQEMMSDPVIAADGHTYERVAIEQWLETNDNSPMTNAPLNNKDLVPNHAVRAMIMDYKKRHA